MKFVQHKINWLCIIIQLNEIHIRFNFNCKRCLLYIIFVFSIPFHFDVACPFRSFCTVFRVFHYFCARTCNSLFVIFSLHRTVSFDPASIFSRVFGIVKIQFKPGNWVYVTYSFQSGKRTMPCKSRSVMIQTALRFFFFCPALFFLLLFMSVVKMKSHCFCDNVHFMQNVHFTIEWHNQSNYLSFFWSPPFVTLSIFAFNCYYFTSPFSIQNDWEKRKEKKNQKRIQFEFKTYLIRISQSIFGIL